MGEVASLLRRACPGHCGSLQALDEASSASVRAGNPFDRLHGAGWAGPVHPLFSDTGSS